MSGEEYRRTVADLLEQIDERRRRQLSLEAAGIDAPELERQAEQARRQLAELLH